MLERRLGWWWPPWWSSLRQMRQIGVGCNSRQDLMMELFCALSILRRRVPVRPSECSALPMSSAAVWRAATTRDASISTMWPPSQSRASCITTDRHLSTSFRTANISTNQVGGKRFLLRTKFVQVVVFRWRQFFRPIQWINLTAWRVYIEQTWMNVPWITAAAVNLPHASTCPTASCAPVIRVTLATDSIALVS